MFEGNVTKNEICRATRPLAAMFESIVHVRHMTESSYAQGRLTMMNVDVAGAVFSRQFSYNVTAEKSREELVI